MASRPSKFDFWTPLQSEAGQRDMASRPSKPDLRCEFQSEPGQSTMACSPSKPDFRCEFQSEPGQSTMACSPSMPDLCREPSKFARLRCVARGIGSLGDWRDVIEMLNFEEKRFWLLFSFLLGAAVPLGLSQNDVTFRRVM